MLESVGHPVIKLLRIRMGPIALGDLQPGEFRFLTDREANTLRRLIEERVAAVGEMPETAPPRRPEKREGWARAKKGKIQRRRGAWKLGKASVE
jgi:23S rRNA pseudouridine2605 synthase